MLPASITVLDLSAYVGLAAVGAITLNMLLGLLMAFRYSPHRSWPHHRFNYFRFHNWTGYMALAVSILHPVILLFNKDPHFRIRDLVYPVQSPSQPLDNTIGAIALYLLAFAVVTSYWRIRLGRHLWKAATAANSSSNLACSSSPPAACCACALPAKSPTCPPSRSADSQRHVSVVGKKR